MGTILDTLVKHAHDTMESQNRDVNAPEALRKTERDLDIALTDCKALHNTMLKLFDLENVEKEIEYIEYMRAIKKSVAVSKHLSRLKETITMGRTKAIRYNSRKSRCRHFTEM